MVTFLFSGYLFGQKHEKGIKFYEGSWEELLAKAKKEKKPFFVDFYTTWCYPCKLLEKKTFSDEKLGEYANKTYIAYRVNAESKTGLPLARKYGIRAYPTVVFFDKDGNVVGRHIGYVGPAEFKKVMQKYEGVKASQGEADAPKTLPIKERVILKNDEELTMLKKK